MNVSDLESALALPFRRDTSPDSVVGGVLVTLAAFATPLAGVALVGYVARLVRGGGSRSTGLPTFDETVALVVEGTRLSAVLVALQLPAVGIAAAVFTTVGPSAASIAYIAGPASLGSLGLSALAAAGLLVAGAAALVGGYLSAAATVAVARERSLVAALPVARTLASDRSFVPVVGAASLVVLVGRLFGFLVGGLPLVGGVLTAGVTFLALVVSATLLGRGAAGILAGSPVASPPSATGPPSGTESA